MESRRIGWRPLTNLLALEDPLLEIEERDGLVTYYGNNSVQRHRAAGGLRRILRRERSGNSQSQRESA
jgi:hypothetical protein